MRGSPRHGVTTHNWFEHYLWDIYGGFGHNGKIIQRTLPSHTQPSPSKLAAWASFRNFAHFGHLEEKHVRESLRHGVTTNNWFGHYLLDIASWLPAAQFLKLHTLRERNMGVKVSDTVLPPITGLDITFGIYIEALGTMGR